MNLALVDDMRVLLENTQEENAQLVQELLLNQKK
jgi:hypothetical protein